MSRISVVALVFLALPLTTAPQPSTEISGVVFEDRDQDGNRDPGEPGLAGVVVSNQIDVTMTDRDGRFTLPGPGTGVVFVRVPAEHRPVQGVQGFWRKAATRSPLSFALTRAVVQEEFTFIHASDPHVSEASLPRMARLREIVAHTRPAFVLMNGDLVRDALRVGEAEARGYYALYARAASELGAPVLAVPGNHELFGIERHRSLVSPDHPLYGRKMYREILGPDYYSFDYGRVHFIGINSVDFEDLWYYGHVDADQLRWIERDLERVEPGATVVTFQHIPFVSGVLTASGYDEESVAPTLIRLGGKSQFRHVVSNAQEVLSRFRSYRHTLALGGHFHARERLQFETDGQPTRFYQTAAVVGPSEGGMTFTSGVTLYRVRGELIDDGEFLPLDASAH